MAPTPKPARGKARGRSRTRKATAGTLGGVAALAALAAPGSASAGGDHCVADPTATQCPNSGTDTVAAAAAAAAEAVGRMAQNVAGTIPASNQTASTASGPTPDAGAFAGARPQSGSGGVKDMSQAQLGEAMTKSILGSSPTSTVGAAIENVPAETTSSTATNGSRTQGGVGAAIGGDPRSAMTVDSPESVVIPAEMKTDVVVEPPKGTPHGHYNYAWGYCESEGNSELTLHQCASLVKKDPSTGEWYLPGGDCGAAGSRKAGLADPSKCEAVVQNAKSMNVISQGNSYLALFPNGTPQPVLEGMLDDTNIEPIKQIGGWQAPGFLGITSQAGIDALSKGGCTDPKAVAQGATDFCAANIPIADTAAFTFKDDGSYWPTVSVVTGYLSYYAALAGYKYPLDSEFVKTYLNDVVMNNPGMNRRGIPAGTEVHMPPVAFPVLNDDGSAKLDANNNPMFVTFDAAGSLGTNDPFLALAAQLAQSDQTPTIPNDGSPGANPENVELPQGAQPNSCQGYGCMWKNPGTAKNGQPSAVTDYGFDTGYVTKVWVTLPDGRTEWVYSDIGRADFMRSMLYKLASAGTFYDHGYVDVKPGAPAPTISNEAEAKFLKESAKWSYLEAGGNNLQPQYVPGTSMIAQANDPRHMRMTSIPVLMTVQHPETGQPVSTGWNFSFAVPLKADGKTPLYGMSDPVILEAGRELYSILQGQLSHDMWRFDGRAWAAMSKPISREYLDEILKRREVYTQASDFLRSMLRDTHNYEDWLKLTLRPHVRANAVGVDPKQQH